MRLSEVSIENYRSIHTCKIRFRELTALVGENNAGKTAILRALNSFFNFEKEARYFYDNTHQHLPRTVTKISLSFTDVPDKDIYAGKISASGILTIRMSYSYSQSGTHKPTYEFFKDMSYSRIEADFIVALKEDIDFVYIPAGRSGSDLVWGEDTIFSRMLSSYMQEYTRNRDTLSSRVSQVAKSIRSQALPAFERDLSSLNMLDHVGEYRIDFTDDIGYSVLLDKLGLSIDENGKTRSITEYGSGVKSLSVISLHRMLAKLNKVSIILGIEEPETNLHPQAQKKLIASLKNNRQECETQAIFATHSPVIIDALEHDDIVLVRRIKDTKRPHLSKVTQLAHDFWTQNELQAEQHYRFFKLRNSEFFFAKFVILVESTTDAQVIEHMISEKLGDAFYDVSIIALDGVKSIKYPYCLLNNLEIPFIAIVDRDMLTNYKHDTLKESRGTNGFPEYTNQLSVLNPLAKLLFNSEDEKLVINEELKGSYTSLFSYMETKHIFIMQYCLEMDMLTSEKIAKAYYDELNIPADRRSVKYLLENNSKAIKEVKHLIPALQAVTPKDYPHSFKKIRAGLLKKIQECL